MNDGDSAGGQVLDIQEISDRLEMQELLVSYATAVDGKDFDALDRIFTPDARIDYTAVGGIAGTLTEIKEFLTSSMAQLTACQHLIANPTIQFDGDHATGRVMCFNTLGFPVEGADSHLVQLGLWYNDEYTRTPRGWRILRRSVEHNWTQDSGDVLRPGN